MCTHLQLSISAYIILLSLGEVKSEKLVVVFKSLEKTTPQRTIISYSLSHLSSFCIVRILSNRSMYDIVTAAP